MDGSGRGKGHLALRAGGQVPGAPGATLGHTGEAPSPAVCPLCPPRGWSWSRLPGAPARLTSACSISTRSRPTMR